MFVATIKKTAFIWVCFFLVIVSITINLPSKFYLIYCGKTIDVSLR